MKTLHIAIVAVCVPIFLWSCTMASKEKMRAYELQIKELQTTIHKKDKELKQTKKALHSVKIKLKDAKKSVESQKLPEHLKNYNWVDEENIENTVEICVIIDEVDYDSERKEPYQTCYNITKHN